MPGSRGNQEIRDLIADSEAFVNGSKTVQGLYVDGMAEGDGIGLRGEDLEVFLRDAPFISYVVLSYDTPIHWIGREEGEDAWFTIQSPPSKTSAGHRNLCPGYGQTREPGWTRKRMPDGTRPRIRINEGRDE